MFEEDNLEKEYDRAIQIIMSKYNKKGDTSNELVLNIYGLYQQINHGDNNEKPDFKTLKDKKKWESWKTFKGFSTLECKYELIEISKVIDKY